MGMRNKQEKKPETVSEAIETLSKIAESDDTDLNPSGQRGIKQIKSTGYRKDPQEIMGIIEEKFKIILDYLHHFYENEQNHMNKPQAIEGIKTIMVIVGDAAKKLDRYTALFQKTKQHQITELKVYKKLQEFYHTKIEHQIDESLLGKWLLQLSQSSIARQQELNTAMKAFQSSHVFVDLESVKKDTEYELFFIRKEDGSHFFSSRLLRSIKLISNFGAQDDFPQDNLFFHDMKVWQNDFLQSAARTILRSLGSHIEEFYRIAFKFKGKSFIGELNMAFMALRLCSHANQDAHHHSAKGSFEYFSDFQKYLREALHSPDYHKLITYTPSTSDELGRCLLNLSHAICQALYLNLQRFQEFNASLQMLLSEGREGYLKDHHEVEATWGSHFEHDYAGMHKFFKRHANGPQNRLLEALEGDAYRAFDPFSQLNFPNRLYSFIVGEHRISGLHLPSPTYQEYIDKAIVLDEFKGFLRSYCDEDMASRHLLINLQDRTSWKEHFRSIALEDLQMHVDFEDCLTVVTLPKDTDFYHQLAPYSQDNNVESFFNHFRAHLGDEHSGYYFSPGIKKAILGDFATGVMEAIHRIFFSNKNLLTLENRLAFIEIFDLFVVLKLIELTKPDSFSLTCKDGIDIGSPAHALLFTFLRMLDSEPLNDQDWKQVNMLLYAPSILVRERILQPERFERMLKTLKVIELAYHDLGCGMFGKVIHEAFGSFYKSPILQTKFL